MRIHEPVPIACKLRADALEDRLRWIKQLIAQSLRSYQRDDLTLHLRFASDAMNQVQELVERERDCCGFLTFEIQEHAEAVHLKISVPEVARDAAAELLDYFSP